VIIGRATASNRRESEASAAEEPTISRLHRYRV
jgi:hypothetical protein